MGLFCKKSFFFPPLFPVSFTNALRPDCPSRKFREQQNYSENSESAEGTESTEDPEDSELTAFRIACQVGQAFLPALLRAHRASLAYAPGWTLPHQRAVGRAGAFLVKAYTGQGQPRRALYSLWVVAGYEKPVAKK